MKKRSVLRYYFPEIKTISLVVLIVAAIAVFLKYRTVIAQNIFSEKGMTVLLGVIIGGVAGTVIRIYYRVVVIRYTRKEGGGE